MATSMTSYLLLYTLLLFVPCFFSVQSGANRPEPLDIEPKPFGSVLPCKADEPGSNCPLTHMHDPEIPGKKEEKPVGSKHGGGIEPGHPHNLEEPQWFLDPKHPHKKDEPSHADPELPHEDELSHAEPELPHKDKPSHAEPQLPHMDVPSRAEPEHPKKQEEPSSVAIKPEHPTRQEAPAMAAQDPMKQDASLPIAPGHPKKQLEPTSVTPIPVPDHLTKQDEPLKPTGHQDPIVPRPRPVDSSDQPGNGTMAALNDDQRNEKNDADNLQVALNLEFLEAEFFLNSVFGEGLDKIAPYLVEGGPLPKGAQKAKLDSLTSSIILQFALQKIGHLRAIQKTLGKYYFGRPQLNIGKEVFADFIDKALGEKLSPPFDVYASPINYFIGVYIIPYVGLTGYVGTSPNLLTSAYKSRVAGLLAVEAGQDAVTREYLFERMHEKVAPYDFTVAEFADKISALRNGLSNNGILDEGVVVPKALGAEKLVEANVISADVDSLAYGRTPEQVFSTVYGTGDASKPGGFYPLGAKGVIAEGHLTSG